MKQVAFWMAIATMIGVFDAARASGHADETSATAAVTLPDGYRDWKLISVAHEAGPLNDFRAILGNDAAIKAYRENTLPFPDGSIIVRLAWKYTSSEENNKVFGREQSYVAGDPINVQVMIKDSKNFATTGGWGFGQFREGKPDPTAKLETCFPCHEPAKQHDLLFTHYAKNP